jgi:hypothetical protein
LEGKILMLEERKDHDSQEEIKLTHEKIKRLQINLDNFSSHKLFLDIYSDTQGIKQARVVVLDPRILDVPSLDLFLDVFKKNIKKVRETYKFKTN